MDYNPQNNPGFDVVSLEVKRQMWIILIFDYNPWILEKKLLCTPWVLSVDWEKFDLKLNFNPKSHIIHGLCL